MFKVEINTDNAAFEYPESNVIRLILKDISFKISRGEKNGTIMDINGNSVGKWDYNK